MSAEKKPKDKLHIATRKPRQKAFDNLRTPEQVDPSPIDELFPELKERLERESIISAALPNPTKLNQANPTKVTLPTSLKKNYAKMPNSHIKHGIPQKLFKGLSRDTYDALFLQTRGAVVPKRTMRATRRELMDLIGISDITLATHTKHLETVGLIKVTRFSGKHEGSIYEVFTLEEIEGYETLLNHTKDTLPNQPNQSGLNQANDLGDNPTKEVGLVGYGNPVENKEDASTPKTSFKTLEKTFDDDEPFGEMLRHLKSAFESITGKKPTVADIMKWGDIGETLAIEMKIAASRTENVSNVPAFFGEHLRRRLFKKDREEKEEKGIAAPIDYSNCPDCKGSTLYFPEGYGKGAVKCEHPKLKEGN